MSSYRMFAGPMQYNAPFKYTARVYSCASAGELMRDTHTALRIYPMPTISLPCC